MRIHINKIPQMIYLKSSGPLPELWPGGLPVGDPINPKRYICNGLGVFVTPKLSAPGLQESPGVSQSRLN